MGAEGRNAAAVEDSLDAEVELLLFGEVFGGRGLKSGTDTTFLNGSFRRDSLGF